MSSAAPAVIHVPLTQGHVAIVDATDAEKVARHRWHLKTQKKRPGKYYAQTTLRVEPGRGGKKVTVQLHRYLLDAPDGQVVDHINGNPLDNRRANLRLCSVRENSTNVTDSKNQKRGGFKGVSWNKNAGKWEAGIAIGEVRANGKRKRVYLGLFVDPVNAALAYDAAALRHFGEFAALNFDSAEPAAMLANRAQRSFHRLTRRVERAAVALGGGS